LEKAHFWGIIRTVKPRKKEAAIAKKPSRSSAKPSPEKRLQEVIEKTLSQHKALNIATIDLTGKSDIADAMIIASGTSQRHIGALADHLLQALKKHGVSLLHTEGHEPCDWLLIDAGDVIVHLFKPEMRQIYNLEKMWEADLPSEEVAVV
jgi:ribosome-associated protein